MNAAQTSQLSAFPKARGNQAPNARAAKKSKTKTRAPKVKATTLPIPADAMLCNECLQQAEICREQAQEAARMKRFKAARGLFATAIALCQRALSACAARNKERAGVQNSANVSSVNSNGEALNDDFLNGEDAAIQAYLQQLNIEMATYSDLARSMERPLNPHAHAHSDS